KDENGTPYYS
ncbi:hypothetical protein CFC21_099849, partial [Triticum aestivum]